MDAPTQNTALLLFLRSESEEALAKPLARGGRRVNKAVFQKLNHHAQRQARKSGLPLLTVKGRQQSGHTFGERLANAFEYAFAQGYGRIIAIGNDCLALDADRLREAAICLEHTDVVLGPAKDGGVYLLGLSRQAYNRRFFLQLPWQTSLLCSALRRYASQWGHTALLLREEEDADDAPSFLRLAGRLSTGSLLRQELEGLLAYSNQEGRLSIPLLSCQYRHSVSKRGPPSLH
ncbi:MAG: DUF2064 domain-containing protein [Lewinellaceae bacterium]|nr:DUF2064 domain-containing protein [Phaeodactylibacter sp.]MCB9351856.1 DUF2064 domain-containing protein [Lewinellaceae bacterium]